MKGEDIVNGNNAGPSFHYYILQKEYSEISEEQFKKFVLKEDMKEKEIIGYTLKNEKYRKPASAIADKVDCFLYPISNGYTVDKISEDLINALKEYEVFDKWFEPVYKEKEKFKVGDWVYVKGNEVNDNGILKIDHFSKSAFNDKQVAVGTNEEVVYIEQYPDNFRLATKEEIEKHLINIAKEKGFVYGNTITKTASGKPLNALILEKDDYFYDEYSDTLCIMANLLTNVAIYCEGKWATVEKYSLPVINGYEGKIRHVEDYNCHTVIEYGCAIINVKTLEDILKASDKFLTHGAGNRKVTAVTLDSGVSITMKQIQQILDYIKSKS